MIRTSLLDANLARSFPCVEIKVGHDHVISHPLQQARVVLSSRYTRGYVSKCFVKQPENPLHSHVISVLVAVTRNELLKLTETSPLLCSSQLVQPVSGETNHVCRVRALHIAYFL
jgi:hypothetical protein